jgi:hypothetical protein
MAKIYITLFSVAKEINKLKELNWLRVPIYIYLGIPM